MLGYDPAEHVAYVVARYSIERRASRPVHVSPIVLSDLKRAALYSRPTFHLDGQLFDVISHAPISTEFAISRFFIPHLADTDNDEWILFADSDIVCLVDIAELFDWVVDHCRHCAIAVVKHTPTWCKEPAKKVNKIQTSYPRKYWSSVVMWNVRHPAHAALTLPYLNTADGLSLHQFEWLDLDQIGGLHRRWNWLVNVEPPCASPAIAHFTLGGPWLPDWLTVPNDDIWLAEKASYDLEMHNS